MEVAVSGAEQALSVLRDYVQRSTHWQNGGADRHGALHEALPELQEHLKWLEKGIQEWKDLYTAENKKAKTAQATAQIAISHLHEVLNKSRTHDAQQRADTAARQWLDSIGSEA
jgi:hypothetical protein